MAADRGIVAGDAVPGQPATATRCPQNRRRSSRGQRHKGVAATRGAAFSRSAPRRGYTLASLSLVWEWVHRRACGSTIGGPFCTLTLLTLPFVGDSVTSFSVNSG